MLERVNDFKIDCMLKNVAFVQGRFKVAENYVSVVLRYDINKTEILKYFTYSIEKSSDPKPYFLLGESEEKYWGQFARGIILQWAI